jgi:uncharacterized protein YukE
MISIDFNKTHIQAEAMARCADGLKQQRNKLVSLIAEIRSAWQGERSAAYIKKLEALSAKMENDAKQCHEHVMAFRTKIDSIKAAEENARSILERH